ncbi:MAG: hypothetical protein ABSG53_20255 [Thermoguttaceae bacterium]
MFDWTILAFRECVYDISPHNFVVMGMNHGKPEACGQSSDM